MTAGEWHETAWCLDSWHEDVWTDFGGAVEQVIILFAAPGEGVATHLRKLVVTISVFYGSTIVSIDDGTTTYFAWSAKTGAKRQPPSIDFGDKGFYWGKNKAIRLVISDDNAEAFGKAEYYNRG